MTKYASDQNRTSFQYESGTYAATSGTIQWLGLVQEHSLEPNMNVQPIRYQGSTDRNVDDFVDGNQEWAGTITYYPQDWKFLGFAIGSIHDLTGSHIFTEMNNNDHVMPPGETSYPNALHTFTTVDTKNIGTAGSNFSRTTIGGMVDSYTLTAAQGEPVEVEVSYTAQDSTLGSIAVSGLTPSTTKPYMFNEVKLYIPEATAVSNVKELTFSVNNNLEPGMYLNGSRVLTEILPMNRDYEVTATLDMDTSNAKTYYESYYTAGSEFNSAIKVWGKAGSVTIIMSGCKMTEMEVPSALEDIQEQSITYVPQHVVATAMDTTSKYNPW